MKQGERISILDGFRFLAILPVLLYHFYSRWTPPLADKSYYPFGNSYSRLFLYGNLGVAFFFIISGFVIFYTLETCKTYGDFLSKRFVRLFPAMLFCSVITFILVPLLDPTNAYPAFHSKSAANFIPSLTFSSPYIWNRLYGTTAINYISGSYWSLWVEVSFYILAGGLFFINKERFVTNWLYAVLAILLITRGASFLTGNNIVTHEKSAVAFDFLNKIITADRVLQLNPSGYNLYFSLGIIFYCLYSGKRLSYINYSIIAGLVFFNVRQSLPGQIVILFLMSALFFVFIYKPHYLHFLESRFIVRMGIASYSLYLIHECIGVILIGKIATFISMPYLYGLIPLLVIVMLIAFSLFEYNLFEKPAIRLLRKVFAFKRKENRFSSSILRRE